jgi:TolB-like protein
MKKRSRLVVAFVATAVLALSAFAQPDLVVSRVRILPEMPLPGSVVTVTAVIENAGDEATGTPFDVRFGDGHREISSSVIPADFDAGDVREILAAWVAEPGTHTLSVGVDQPSDDVTETDETNNTESLAVLVPALDGASPRVAVTAFDDQSRMRLANLGAGVADKLADRLAASGVRIVARGEIETLMQEEGLNPTSFGDLARAAQELGVDLLITGTVEDVAVAAMTLDLGLVRLTSAEARAAATARMIDASADAVVAVSSASGSGKGTPGLSIYLGSFFSPSPSCDACGGGLVSERTAYAEGELVSFGYVNPSASGWFGLEVYDSDGAFLRWLGWHFVTRDACETWFWNQRDALGSSVGAGIYVARLRDGDAHTETVTFQIRPGLSISLPSLDQVTVGTSAFDSDIVGVAIDDVVDQLAASLLPAIMAHRSPSVAAPPADDVPTASEETSSLLGQVASVLPDGRVAVNVGSSSGVAVGDHFEVLAVDHLVFDPETLAVVAYDVLETQGEIRIVEVRERVSYGVCQSAFEPLVGDLVRFVP